MRVGALVVDDGEVDAVFVALVDASWVGAFAEGGCVDNGRSIVVLRGSEGSYEVVFGGGYEGFEKADA